MKSSTAEEPAGNDHRPDPGPALLSVEDLRIVFDDADGPRPVVDAVDLQVSPGRTLGLVGESGCGKTLTALGIMGLLPPAARVESGRVVYGGKDLLRVESEAMRRIRGPEMAMVFQEPMTALNPLLTIGRQVAEPLMAHRRASRAEALREAVRWLRRVRIPDAANRMREYPHQLSGGMRQRVMIAAALICRPRLLVADEPTTALDVTVQAQILNLILELKTELGMAVLLITHDLGVVAQTASEVAVMYAGQIVESAPVMALFTRPFHPYTQGLLAALPAHGSRVGDIESAPREIPGSVPNRLPATPGCRFAPRCPQGSHVCRRTPPMRVVGQHHQARCWLGVDSQRRPAE